MRDIEVDYISSFGERVMGINENAVDGIGGQADGEPFLPAQLAPLALAYVGDAVYEVYVRSMLASSVKGNVHRLHTEATEYARCASQADVIRSIFDTLTEHEQDVVRRGRNTHSGYVPKNANVAEYRYATGFEALLGFLFLNRDFDRLNYILQSATRRVGTRRVGTRRIGEGARKTAAESADSCALENES